MWLHNLCILRVPIRGKRPYGYIAGAFVGVHTMTEGQDGYVTLVSPGSTQRGRNTIAK